MRVVFAVAALAIGAAMVFAAHHPIALLHVIGSPPQVITVDAVKFYRRGSEQEPTAGPVLFRDSGLSITYKPRIYVTAEEAVEVVYSVQRRQECLNKSSLCDDFHATGPHDPEPVNRMDGKLVLRLSSASFDIAPSAEIVNDGKRLPFRATWTIAAKQEGDRKLLLRVEEETGGKGSFEKARMTSRMASATLNGEPIGGNDGIYLLPVYVVSPFGVPTSWIGAGGYLMATFGAVFVFLWSEAGQNFLKWLLPRLRRSAAP